MGGSANYNPVSQAGADDVIEPAVLGGKQIYKHLTAVGKNPVPVRWGRLGAGVGAGIVAESTTQNLLDATRGGKPNPNPYLANLEKLGSRMVGGTVAGGVTGQGNPRVALLGAITGAAIDAGENIYGIAKAIPELYDHYKWNESQRQKERNETVRAAWENLQKLQKERNY